MFQSFVFLPFVTKFFKELANDLGMRVEVADSKRASIFIICEKFIKSFLFWSPFHCITSCTLATGPYEWCQNIDWSILRYVYSYFYSILHASLPLPPKKQNWAHLHHYLQSSRIGDPLLTLCSEIVNFNQLTNFVECKTLFYSMMNPNWKFVSQTSFMPWNYQRKHLWSCPRVKTHSVCSS